jgi:general stress protein YciG
MDESLSKKRAAAGRKGGKKGGRAKVKKGFATMPIEKLRKIGRKGAQSRLTKRVDGMEYEDFGNM